MTNIIKCPYCEEEIDLDDVEREVEGKELLEEKEC